LYFISHENTFFAIEVKDGLIHQEVQNPRTFSLNIFVGGKRRVG